MESSSDGSMWVDLVVGSVVIVDGWSEGVAMDVVLVH